MSAIRWTSPTWPLMTTGLAGTTDEACLGGALGGTRTPNLLIRSQMLYPIELRAQRSECTSHPEPAPPSVTGATWGGRPSSGRLAERVGFEPTMSFWAHTPLAGERLQPDSATSPRDRMLPAARRPRTFADTLRGGGMAEWTIATVLKTVEPHGSGGSNPPPSASHRRTFIEFPHRVVVVER